MMRSHVDVLDDLPPVIFAPVPRRFGSASVAPAYDDVCIDPIFDLSTEAQQAIARQFPDDLSFEDDLLFPDIFEEDDDGGL